MSYHNILIHTEKKISIQLKTFIVCEYDDPTWKDDNVKRKSNGKKEHIRKWYKNINNNIHRDEDEKKREKNKNHMNTLEENVHILLRL